MGLMHRPCENEHDVNAHISVLKVCRLSLYQADRVSDQTLVRGVYDSLAALGHGWTSAGISM